MFKNEYIMEGESLGEKKISRRDILKTAGVGGVGMSSVLSRNSLVISPVFLMLFFSPLSPEFVVVRCWARVL